MAHNSPYTGAQVDTAIGLINRWINNSQPTVEEKKTLHIYDNLILHETLTLNNSAMIEKGLSIRSLNNGGGIISLETGPQTQDKTYYLPNGTTAAESTLALKSNITLDNIMPGVTAPSGSGQLALVSQISTSSQRYLHTFTVAYSDYHDTVSVENKYDRYFTYQLYNDWSLPLTKQTLFKSIDNTNPPVFISGSREEWESASQVFARPVISSRITTNEEVWGQINITDVGGNPGTIVWLPNDSKFELYDQGVIAIQPEKSYRLVSITCADPFSDGCGIKSELETITFPTYTDSYLLTRLFIKVPCTATQLEIISYHNSTLSFTPSGQSRLTVRTINAGTEDLEIRVYKQ